MTMIHHRKLPYTKVGNNCITLGAYRFTVKDETEKLTSHEVTELFNSFIEETLEVFLTRLNKLHFFTRYYIVEYIDENTTAIIRVEKKSLFHKKIRCR